MAGVASRYRRGAVPLASFDKSPGSRGRGGFEGAPVHEGALYLGAGETVNPKRLRIPLHAAKSIARKTLSRAFPEHAYQGKTNWVRIGLPCFLVLRTAWQSRHIFIINKS